MTAFEKLQQAERNMLRLLRKTETGPFDRPRGNAQQRRRLEYWTRQYERQLARAVHLEVPDHTFPEREETPEGMCPMCYDIRGEGIQLEYNERTECDECPNCDYYQ